LATALNGTSATFTEGFINGVTDAFFHINRSASGNAARLRFQTAGTTDFQIGLVGGLSGFRILNSAGTTAFTLLESGEATFINNLTLNEGYLISLRSDNTTALRSHLFMRRGNGTGTYADIMTTGNTSNGAGSIQFGFNSSPKMILTDGGMLTLGDYTPIDTFGTGRVLDIGSADGGSVIIRDTTNPSTQYGGMSYNGNTDNGLRLWSNGFFGVNLSGVRQFTVENNGNTTIGSGTNGGYKLYVVGDIRGGRIFTYSGGNATDPIIAPADDTNTGIYFPAENTFAICTTGVEAFKINSLQQVRVNGFVPGYDGSSANFQINGFMRIGGQIILHNSANTGNEVGISCIGAASFYVAGALSKASGSFRIDHPLETMSETHQLVHSFVESPQANNIYRGKIQLKNGKALINLDEVSTMTEGTFEALNRDIHTYTSNETDWDSVTGKVNGNILTIECQNNESNAIVSWLVIGERHDKHMMNTDWTDENGKVIVEPMKQIQKTF